MFWHEKWRKNGILLYCFLLGKRLRGIQTKSLSVYPAFALIVAKMARNMMWIEGPGVYRRKYVCTTPQIGKNGVEKKCFALYTPQRI